MKNPKGFKKSLRKRSHHLLERTYSLRAKNEKLKYERMMIVDLKHFKFFRCTKRHTFNAGSPPQCSIYIIQQNLNFIFLSLCDYLFRSVIGSWLSQVRISSKTRIFLFCNKNFCKFGQGNSGDFLKSQLILTRKIAHFIKCKAMKSSLSRWKILISYRKLRSDIS